MAEAAAHAWHARTLSRVRVHARAWLSRGVLPPGDLIDLEAAERHDRRLLLARAERYGPVSKALANGQLLVCVVGLAAGRRLLKAHTGALQPVTLQLRSLFPLGFLRQMEGDDHRRVRRAIVRGLTAVDLSALAVEMEHVAATGLRALPQQGAAARPDSRTYGATLGGLASAMLLRLFFGAAPGSAAFERLMQGYQRLGPNGLLWNINDRQADAFHALRGELRQQAGAHARSPDAAFGRGLLARLADAEAIDDTLLGNLIYMVEMGRYDLRGLLRWTTHYAAEQPAWMERIAAEARTAHDAWPLAEAFVLETLRMDQSERLMRRVRQDIVFDGYLIPKGSVLRLCLWEAHKADDAFARPFDFDPERFVGAAPGPDHFSPFGLDHHHCPFAAASVHLASAFVRALASGFHVDAAARGAAVRGAYHWEPAPSFTVTLRPRAHTSAA